MNKENLKLGYIFNEGIIDDISEYDNSSTVTGDIFQYGKNGIVATGDKGGKITVDNNSNLELDAFTVILRGDLYDLVKNNSVIFDKRSALGVDILAYFDSPNTLKVYNGALSSLSIPLADVFNSKTLTLKKASGSSVVKVYIDGVYFGSTSTAITVNGNDYDITLLSTYNNGNQIIQGLNAFLLYNDEKSDSDIVDIHEELLRISTPNIGTKNFLTYDSCEVMENGSNWNMRVTKNKVYDVTDSNHGDANQVYADRMPWGEHALKFNGSSSYINCGNDSSLNFTDEIFGAYVWVNIRSLATLQMFLNRGASGVDGYYFYVKTNGELVIQSNNSGLGGSNVVTSTTRIDANKNYLIGFLFTETEQKIFINNVEDKAGSRVDPKSNVRNFTIGRYATSVYFLNSLMSKLVIKEFTNEQEFLDELNTEWDRVTGKLLYRESLDTSYITSSYTTGGQIEGTDITVKGGGIRIVQGTNKYIQGQDSSSWGTLPHHENTDGTYEWDAVAVAGQSNIFCPLSDGQGVSTGNRLSINVGDGANSQISVSDNTGSLYTGTTVTTGEHKMKVVIKDSNLYTNNCTLYMDDVEITEFRHIPTSVTKMIVAPQSGSMIKNITHKF